MNLRQKRILQYLLDQDDYVTVNSIAETFEVSPRTIHNDLTLIEENLNQQDISMVKKPKKGIKVEASLSKKSTMMNMVDLKKESVDALSTKMRRFKILSLLLTNNEGTSLNKLSDEFLVSKTSIVSDLDIIADIIEDYDLTLIKDRKGTRIEGTEENIRHALSYVASSFIQLDFEEEKLETQDTRLDLSTYYRLKNIFDLDDITSLERILRNAQQKLGYTINDISYVNLLTHLLILIKRMTKVVAPITEKEANSVYTIQKDQKSWKAAEYISKEIERNYEVEIDNKEVAYIHQYLVCSGIQSDFLHLSLDNYQLPIDDDVKQVIAQMIKFVSDIVHVSLIEDKELQLSLITHVIPLIQRVKYKIKIENPLLEEIKVQYSAMFSIVALALEMMDNSLLKHLNEDEIGFLTIHFQAAVERAMQQKKVIIVCPEGIGFSRLIAHRIERFISSIEIVDIVSLTQLKTTDLTSIDFIISTVPIKDCPKKVIIVSSFINESDISSLNNFLVENTRTKKKSHYENLSLIVNENVIYPNLEFTTRDEVLNYMCDQLEKHHYVTSQYKESVFQREKIMSTDLGNLVAIPHGSEKEIIEPRIAIATLKNPIKWSENDVSIIFLIAVNMNNPQVTKNILKDLYAIIDNRNMLQAFIHAKDKKEIINYICE